MVGETRDVETAQIAIQASLTGHLVFSTLHLERATDAVRRIIEVFPEPRDLIRRTVARNLAAVIADKDSDVAQLFVKSGRMKELVEAFASCSKALAIVSGEKKGPVTSSKKLRELGWSRELWSIKP